MALKAQKVTYVVDLCKRQNKRFWQSLWQTPKFKLWEHNADHEVKTIILQSSNLGKASGQPQDIRVISRSEATKRFRPIMDLARASGRSQEFMESLSRFRG